jgi:hypothetical protein
VVVVIEPATIAGRILRGLRSLYICLTRATKEMCPVFGPADAVYVETSGDTWASADIPKEGKGACTTGSPRWGSTGWWSVT